MLDALKKSRIALLGFGVENQALARFLAARGISFSVCDAREPAGRPALERELGGLVQQWHVGTGYLDGLENFDLVFRTPGISPQRPELRQAREKGVRFSSQTRLFAALSPAPIAGVTGTKGKGTTTSLLAEMLRDGPFRQVHVGGNIGRPPIAWLEQVEKGDLVILELSSFQLIDWERSPQLAVVLSITGDHLDYHGSLAEYVEAKRAICRFQTAADWLIVDQDCPVARGFAATSAARKLAFSVRQEVEAGAWVAGERLWLRSPDGQVKELMSLTGIPLRGRHNWGNAAAAAAAALALEAPVDQLKAGIGRFRGLPHRLEWVGEYGGVAYYDDSLATTPEAAIAAIQAFSEPLVLIAGGSSKGAEFAALGAAIVQRGVKAVVLIGAEAGRLAAALRNAGGFAGELITGCTTMQTAVAAARERSRPGGVVLLSPACASFDMFVDYQDRGEQFKRWAEEGAR